MARINDPFYIKMLCLSREEAILILSLLLCAWQGSDEELETFGKSIGLDGINLREVITSLGESIDLDWNEMVKLAEQAAE